jgi:hypothetical protein
MAGKVKAPVPAWVAIVYGILSTIGIALGEVVIWAFFIRREGARNIIRQLSPTVGAVGIPLTIIVGIVAWLTK